VNITEEDEIYKYQEVANEKVRLFQNFCKLTFPCHSEAEGRRISFFDFLIKKKNRRFFASCRMTMWIFGAGSLKKFTKIFFTVII
jgi:hypothetical protein